MHRTHGDKMIGSPSQTCQPLTENAPNDVLAQKISCHTKNPANTGWPQTPAPQHRFQQCNSVKATGIAMQDQKLQAVAQTVKGSSERTKCGTESEEDLASCITPRGSVCENIHAPSPNVRPYTTARALKRGVEDGQSYQDNPGQDDRELHGVPH